MIMSRFTKMWCLLLVGSMLVACSSKYEGVIETYYKALNSGEINAALRQLMLESDSDADQARREINDIMEVMKNSGGLKAVRIFRTSGPSQWENIVYITYQVVLNNGNKFARHQMLVPGRNNVWKIIPEWKKTWKGIPIL